MGEPLPFSAEYAKSGRASCQGCKNKIEMTVLRIAKIVQSPFHDGTIPKWFHAECFFTKQRPKSTADVANFDELRWDDRQMIQKKIEECGGEELPSGKGKKRGAKSAANKDFLVEYAKSNRSVCVGCEGPIVKGDVRVSKKDFESEKGVQFGGIDRWHHLDCFAKLRAELAFFDGGSALPGHKTLSAEDRKKVTVALPKMSKGDLPPVAKKAKLEPVDEAEEKLMKKQSDAIFKMRDQLSSLKNKDITRLLEYNKHETLEVGASEKLNRLADMMVFGVLEPCSKCSGQLIYESGKGYKCTGNLSEWTRCEEVYQNPKRRKFSVPTWAKDVPFLASYKPKIKERMIKVTAPTSLGIVKKEENTEEMVDGPRVKGKIMPLKGMQFVILKSKKSKDELTRAIMNLGGQVTSRISENVAAIIGTPEFVEKNGAKVMDAKAAEIQIISEDFVEEAKDYTDSPISLITKKSICDWGADPSVRVASHIAKSTASRTKSIFEKSGSGKRTLKIKGGGAVDPDSELDDVAHVFQDSMNKYTVTLGITDIQTRKNSYYKLQLLKHDKREKYWLFRSWGRIGTTIGGTKVDSMPKETAIEEFRRFYHEKSGNYWDNRRDFQKMPGKMYPIELEEGAEDPEIGKFESDLNSELDPAIQNLIKLIFDVNQMKKVMLEFELDLEKMPLGKISKNQLLKAYQILTQLQDLTKNGQGASRSDLIGLSNQFYTLVPHSFGTKNVPILESVEDIKSKCDLLDALLDMEIGFKMLNMKKDGSKHPLDMHYEQLKTEIKVLDKTQKEFEIIREYLTNTHAETHDSYSLEIEDIFEISRPGEEKRFKPFKKLPNRKLLWHGSRTTNFAGILSEGLRIAPPEAPVTGYMFGKGIYFADMVSKSANYCCTNSQNSTGLLLLCEVALGNMYERLQADYIEKLPKGKHSTKGCGATHPDPNKIVITDDGVEVPLGNPQPAPLPKTGGLLYNEYIVYDVAQVKSKYLVRTNFKYKF